MNPYLFPSPEVHFRGHNINFQSIHTSQDANLGINDDLMILNPTANIQIHSFCVNKIPESGNTRMVTPWEPQQNGYFTEQTQFLYPNFAFRKRISELWWLMAVYGQDDRSSDGNVDKLVEFFQFPACKAVSNWIC